MNVKKLVVIGVACAAGIITVRKIIKRRNKDMMLGYIPKRVSSMISDCIKDIVRIDWKRIGCANSNFGLRLRIYDKNGSEMIKTTQDMGLMVTGVTFEGRQIVIANMKETDVLYLVSNPHEEDATCVEIWRKRK